MKSTSLAWAAVVRRGRAELGRCVCARTCLRAWRGVRAWRSHLRKADDLLYSELPVGELTRKQPRRAHRHHAPQFAEFEQRTRCAERTTAVCRTFGLLADDQLEPAFVKLTLS